MKLPGLNEYTTANRRNQYQGASMKKTTEKEIALYVSNALVRGKIHRHKKQCRLKFVWHEKNMRRDGDNVAFAVKFIQDAMVARGVFPNDNRKYINGLQHDFVLDDDYFVEVTIEEL